MGVGILDTNRDASYPSSEEPTNTMLMAMLVPANVADNVGRFADVSLREQSVCDRKAFDRDCRAGGQEFGGMQLYVAVDYPTPVTRIVLFC
jgi:hypothetical protein